MVKKAPSRTRKPSANRRTGGGGQVRPKVTFRNKASDRKLTDREIEKRLQQGAVIHNTALTIYQAKKRLGPGTKGSAFRTSLARRLQGAAYTLAPAQAIQVSDPGLDRSDETAVAVNPKNPNNIVAGAVIFDGAQFANSAYVSMDGGNTWQTIIALSDTDEGAGIAFDDSGNCYYVTMQGGFNPCCVVSKDGGLTWSAPAVFGFGDKTAVAARGQIALCGFDRVNTEACAFSLDGGLNWTVQDFADSGIGTAPLVAYDQTYFYIIYAALDNNLKIYVSPDQGQTWNGPNIIVAGNASFSSIAGPLSYQGGALTSPGTNVAIDATGRLHVLYIDSTTQLPMYISSNDHATTWSTPANVNPERATDAHMFPCLCCNKDGDLIGGSLVFDQALGKYEILRHVKTHTDTAWKTFETDNGPWSAAGPSPGFRIGFGDYFDCDTIPECGISAMAWSETPTGQEPWQTWARILEPICEEEHKGRCPCAVDLPDIPQECVSPAAPPWLLFSQCIIWYETRYVRFEELLYRIVYEHRACLLGRQQGPLLYTTTLLPGESQKLYHYDRYRRTRSSTEIYTVHTSWRQSVATLQRSRAAQSTARYQEFRRDIDADGSGSITVGGALFPVSWSNDDVDSTTLHGFDSASAQSVSEDFVETATVASQQVDAERSIVISNFEEKETLDVTVREIKNPNHCRAVTYFIRRVNEVYRMSTTVMSVSYAVRGTRAVGGLSMPWQSIDEVRGLESRVQRFLEESRRFVPRVGEVVEAPRPVTLPTDGVVYEPELAHCSSCEPASIAEEQIALEKEKADENKACAEARLVELEVKRRQLLLEKGVLDPFEPAPNPPTPNP